MWNYLDCTKQTTHIANQANKTKKPILENSNISQNRLRISSSPINNPNDKSFHTTNHNILGAIPRRNSQRCIPSTSEQNISLQYIDEADIGTPLNMNRKSNINTVLTNDITSLYMQNNNKSQYQYNGTKKPPSKTIGLENLNGFYNNKTPNSYSGIDEGKIGAQPFSLFQKTCNNNPYAKDQFNPGNILDNLNSNSYQTVICFVIKVFRIPTEQEEVNQQVINQM